MLLVQKSQALEVTAVKQLINILGDAIVGVSSGFDRVVFQGMIRPVMYPEGAMSFFQRRGIMFKDAKKWVAEHTQRLISAVDEWSKRECGQPIGYLSSTGIRKESVARRRQLEKGITVGPIGVWSCVEACGSYRLVPAEGAPRLRYVQTRCKHLYIYLDHSDYGFMSIRIQTWFPYRIQVAVNGREWLSRQLQHAGIGFERIGNKILHFETTINNPSTFRGYRRKQGAPSDAKKQLLPLRKGIADTTLRARVSQNANDRLADHVATMHTSTPLRSVLQHVTTRKRKRGRSVRALEPTAKDSALLAAIADPRFTVGGFRNKHLRLLLADDPGFLGKTEKQRSGKTTRYLRLLRDHGVIRRLPKARRYQLTANGRQLVTALQAALAASTEELTKIAA